MEKALIQARSTFQRDPRLIGLYKKVTFIVLSKVPDAALLEEPEEVKRMTKELLLPSSDDI